MILWTKKTSDRRKKPHKRNCLMKRDLAKYRAAYHSSSLNYDNTAHLVTTDSGIPWISGGNGEEWLYVDLGTDSKITGAVVHWGAPCALTYDLEVSGDSRTWRKARSGCVGAPNARTETSLDQNARYLRVLCRVCSGDHYVIRKIEVFGENRLVYDIPPVPPPNLDGSQPLTGGNWRIRRAAEVAENGAVLSSEGYDDSDWLKATVPGTALVSYLNAGAIPDPNYDDWQFQISETYFTADFWCRNHFLIPESKRGQRMFLNFESINWKADVYFNGTFLKNALPHRKHSIEGAFIRSKFDVTDLIRFGEENYLAVLIKKNANPGEVTTQGLAYGPGKNGGLLGADNPTVHAAVGWDWLPTIRGRNIGIYGDVYLSCGGNAELVDPWIETELRVINESSAIVSENLMERSGILVNGDSTPLRDWRGREGEGFTVDFGEPLTLGSVTLLWGSEAGGAAADVESRHPETFRLETSSDGEKWINFDAYPGGEIDAKWFGILNAEPHSGIDAFDGHAVSDSIQGSTAIVSVDLTRFGFGMREMRFFSPQKVRYLRFTVVKRRELSGRPVDTRVRELRAYAESPQQVEQSMTRSYTLDTSRAELIFRADIRNLSERPVKAELCGKISPGDLTFTRAYELAPGESLPAEIPLVLEDPRLWWPNTYGGQFLYTAEAEIRTDGVLSDKKTFRFGVRRFDYPIDGDLLTLYCNGVRIVCKGGNWGLDEGLKRDTVRILDDKVRLHAEANMTMIRNWVGMTNHPGFYEACDKYGILIWDDFWLANPVDGPDPEDPAMFLENAADKIRRVRKHASLALYCGRNEGYPPDDINAGLERLTKELDGSRLYIPNSAMPPVGSGGGYALAMPGGDKGIKQYFDDVSSSVLRSERGMPNVPNLESLRKFLKPENLWPISESWALHDWTYHLNGPANTYMHALQTYLGGDFHIPADRVQGSDPDESDPVYREYKAAIAEMCREAGEIWTIEDFCRAAQLINYDNHRGMFDALAVRRSNGLLMWMSQSSWPSFMWQAYDYFLDTNGGYFGTKAGNQPTRAVFDPRDDSIFLANATQYRYEDVETSVELYDYYGRSVSSVTYRTDVLEPDAYGVRLGQVDFSPSGTDIVFLRLTLKSRSGEVLGYNDYWHNRKEYQDYRALNRMEQAGISLKVVKAEISESGTYRCAVTVKNGPVPALGVRIRLLGEDGSDELPVFYSDNYLTMMPGEERTVTVECAAELLRGTPVWELSGWNLHPARFPGKRAFPGK
jgi:hypothetical protein